MTEIKKEFKTKLEEFKEKQEAEYKALKEQLEAQTKIEDQLDNVLKTENGNNLKIVIDVLSPVIIRNHVFFDDAVKLELSNKFSSFIVDNFENMNEDFKNSIKSMFKTTSKKEKSAGGTNKKKFLILDAERIKNDFANLFETFKKESLRFYEKENKFSVKVKPYSKEVKAEVVAAGFKDVPAFFKDYKERELSVDPEQEHTVKDLEVIDFKIA